MSSELNREKRYADNLRLVTSWNRVDTMIHKLIRSLDDVSDVDQYNGRKYMVDCAITTVAALIIAAPAGEKK